jgi:hypothetical protein
VVLGEQDLRRTAALVAKAIAKGRTDVRDRGGYAAVVAKQILTADDPADREYITAALQRGLTPEQIADGWDQVRVWEPPQRGPEVDPSGLYAAQAAAASAQFAEQYRAPLDATAELRAAARHALRRGTDVG